MLSLVAVSLLLLSLIVTTLQVWWLKDHNPSSTSWMRMRESQARDTGKTFVLHQTFVPLNSIPDFLPRAVIAAEDAGFYQHHGFDWDAIRKAYLHNEESGHIKRGGSTITQQLAKNLYLSPKRSYLRKIREGVITVALEWLLPKRRILELYLNYIEFGPGIFGVEEASRYHYGKSVKAISADQAFRLAAIIPSPLRYKVNGAYVMMRAERIAKAVGR